MKTDNAVSIHKFLTSVWTVKVSRQLHAPIALPPGTQHTFDMGAPRLVQTWRRTETSLPLPESEVRSDSPPSVYD